MAEHGEITFVLPPGLTKEAVDSQLDASYDNPIASRVLEAARAQLSGSDEFSFTLDIHLTV